jgi:hypothetical protein
VLAEQQPKKRRSRFTYALLAAGATHAFLFVALPRDDGQRLATLDDQEPFSVELFDDAPPRPADEAPAPAAAEPSRQAVPAEAAPNLAKVAIVDKRAPTAEPEAATAPPDGTLGAAGAGPRVESGEAAGARAPINFNLGSLSGRAFAVSTASSAAEAPAPAPPDPAERVRKSLAQAQDDHDRELGLGWGGEVTSAAHSGAVRDAAPGGEGNAVIEVDLDANGAAVSVRVRSASSQSDGWRRVADALLAALRGRSVKGLAGSRGGRVALRFEARERLPSGADSVVKQCGIGVCGDLADLGAQKLRTINVRLERKERL